MYFRAGYTPTDYPGEAEWQARALVERSAAIKCPTLGYQLAGTKKVRQWRRWWEWQTAEAGRVRRREAE